MGFVILSPLTILSETGVCENRVEHLQHCLLLLVGQLAEALGQCLAAERPVRVWEALVRFAVVVNRAAVLGPQLLKPMLRQPAERVAQEATARVLRFAQQLRIDQVAPADDQVVVQPDPVLVRDALALLRRHLVLGDPVRKGGIVGHDQRADLVLLRRLEHEAPLLIGAAGAGVPVQADRDEAVARIEHDRLHLGVPELVQHELVVRLDQDDTLAVHAEYETVAIAPIATVGHGEHRRAVQWVLHDTRQVQHLCR